MLKVSKDNGTTRVVLLKKDLPLADVIAVQGDEVVLVNSMKKLWVLKSQDSWGEGVVYREIDLGEERVLTSLIVENDERVYVIYGYVLEAIIGNLGRKIFGIVGVRSKKENREETARLVCRTGLDY